MKLILGSKSPRRKALLTLLQLPFEVLTTDADESFDAALSPEEIVRFLSRLKADSVAAAYPDAVRGSVVLGADTIVVIDGEVLNKPLSHTDAVRMLSMLQGRTHRVYTGFTLRSEDKTVTDSERTAVTFAPMTPADIETYIRIAQPFDKAGAYGIQDDFGACFIERIDGCYYNVVGLPLAKLYSTLQAF